MKFKDNKFWTGENFAFTFSIFWGVEFFKFIFGIDNSECYQYCCVCLYAPFSPPASLLCSDCHEYVFVFMIL